MENIKLLYELCEKLKNINSVTAKKAFLKLHQEDEEFVNLLKFLLDDKIVTGISKSKLKKKTSVIRAYCPDLKALMNYLEQHNTGRDQDISFCQNYMNQYEGKIKDFIASIITKTLKLGVNTKTVNNVYGDDFIKVHQVQLGSPKEKLRLKNNETFFLTQKLNGIRCTYVNGNLFSRQGQKFEGFNEIVHELSEVEKRFDTSMVFDGELIRRNDEELNDNDNFRLTTSAVNGSDLEAKRNIVFNVFDTFPLKEFEKGESKENYEQRRKWLDKFDIDFDVLFGYGRKVKIVPLWYEGSDTKEIDKWLEYADSHNMEGVMLNKNAPYQCKRTTNLIKIKSFKEVDLEVIAVEEGEGKNTGTLGALVVGYKGNEVNVGAGYTDAQRKMIWENKDDVIGKIITVKYKDISRDKDTGLESLQFPVFIALREDKREAQA